MCQGRRTGPRRVRSSGSSNRRAILRRRSRNHQVYLQQQNCQGLKTDAQLRELAFSFNASRAFCCSLQETWRTGSELFTIDGVNFILFGPKVQTGRGTKGIGFALSNEAFKLWERSGSVKFTSADERTTGGEAERAAHAAFFCSDGSFDTSSDDSDDTSGGCTITEESGAETDDSETEERRARASAAKEQHTPRAASTRAKSRPVWFKPS